MEMLNLNEGFPPTRRFSKNTTTILVRTSKYRKKFFSNVNLIGQIPLLKYYIYNAVFNLYNFSIYCFRP